MTHNTYTYPLIPLHPNLPAGLEDMQYEEIFDRPRQRSDKWTETPAVHQARLDLLSAGDYAPISMEEPPSYENVSTSAIPPCFLGSGDVAVETDERWVQRWEWQYGRTSLGGDEEAGECEAEFMQIQTVDMPASCLPFARSVYPLIVIAAPMPIHVERASLLQPQEKEVPEFDEEMLDESDCSSCSASFPCSEVTPTSHEPQVPPSPFPNNFEDKVDCTASEVDMIDMNDFAIVQLLADMGDQRTALEVRQLFDYRRVLGCSLLDGELYINE
jgi:hypothetical protein